MAVKTITIDMTAYELLQADKRAGESFSRVIRRRLTPVRTARGLLEALPSCLLSETTLDRIEEEVRRRADSPACSTPIDGEV